MDRVPVVARNTLGVACLVLTSAALWLAAGWAPGTRNPYLYIQPLKAHLHAQMQTRLAIAAVGLLGGTLLLWCVVVKWCCRRAVSSPPAADKTM